MAQRPPTIDPDAWVDAAPFAAHLGHLCTATGLPWQVVAQYAGVPLRLAERLVGAGRGRRPRRLSRACAQRILGVHPADLQRVRMVRVPAAATCHRVGDLLARGVPLRALAAQLGCTEATVAELADGTPPTVTAELALRARAACETADRAVASRLTRAA